MFTVYGFLLNMSKGTQNLFSLIFYVATPNIAVPCISNPLTKVSGRHAQQYTDLMWLHTHVYGLLVPVHHLMRLSRFLYFYHILHGFLIYYYIIFIHVFLLFFFLFIYLSLNNY